MTPLQKSNESKYRILNNIIIFTIFVLIISENLPAIQITGIDDQAKGKELIINLFYWLDECRDGIECEQLGVIKPILQLKELSYRPISKS